MDHPGLMDVHMTTFIRFFKLDKRQLSVAHLPEDMINLCMSYLWPHDLKMWQGYVTEVLHVEFHQRVRIVYDDTNNEFVSVSTVGRLREQGSRAAYFGYRFLDEELFYPLHGYIWGLNNYYVHAHDGPDTEFIKLPSHYLRQQMI